MKGCQKVAKSKFYVYKTMKKPRFLGAFSLKVGSVLLSPCFPDGTGGTDITEIKEGKRAYF